MKVSDILQVKGNILFTVNPDELMVNAVHIMEEKDIGSLVVMEFGELKGILTFREVIRAFSQNEGGLGTSTVRKYMDDHPMTVTLNTEMAEVSRMMLEKHSRYMPVLDAQQLMGVISFYDLAQAMIKAKTFENNMLKAYIRDWPAEENV